MTPQECYQAGRLQEAIASATAAVKAKPTDAEARNFLCEMLCFAGDWERLDKQLDVIAHQDPDAMVGAALFRQLLRAEIARTQFFHEGRLPDLLDQPPAAVRQALEASVMLREGKAADAAKLLAQVEEERPKVKGVCNGKAFEDFRDCDDLLAPVLEVLTSTGKYYWIPVERVELIEFRAPARPRDLVWRRAHMIVRDGPDGEVYLPANYIGSSASPDEQVQLGRYTEWKGGEGRPVRGLGQRTYIVGEEGRSILELQNVTFESAATA
ncbi:MAG: SciE type virulence protein [Planctomycetia bacterium]|nr:SciE type virulence protein [Planctomycetia bacterium]